MSVNIFTAEIIFRLRNSRLQTSNAEMNRIHSIYFLCCVWPGEQAILDNLQEFRLRPWAWARERMKILHTSLNGIQLRVWFTAHFKYEDGHLMDHNSNSISNSLRKGTFFCWTFAKPKLKMQLFFLTVERGHPHLQSALIKGLHHQQHHWKFHPYPSHSADG